nr:type II toxin-antitoxin system HicB family antitoxin [uncultured Sphingobium sp.]|tara:strand:+ start:530 stop:751 length:222 start_codon:yes stop_codon:yes gene_type:complete
MTEPHYHINLFWSGKDQCWIADVPDLKPCSAQGNMRAEAITNINDAIEGWLAVAQDRGSPIPDACCRPAIYAA